jgi:hypothetical protein
MSEYDDIMADLFDCIEAIPAAPDLETQNPLDIGAFGVALQVAHSLLKEAETRWTTNARIALPEWEGHYPQPTRKQRQ